MKQSFFILLFLFTSLLVEAQTQLYVSKQGKTKNTGTIAAPFKNLSEAIDKAYTLASDTVVIFMRQGVYDIDKTIEINSSWKGKHLIIRAYQDETVSISGGKAIQFKHLGKVKDKSVYQRLQPEYRDVIREIDLKALGIDVAELRASGFGRPSSGAWTEVFINKEPMHLSRWPNDSTLLIGEVLEAGTGEHKLDAQLPVFKYNEDRPSAWSQTEPCWISGYFAHGYADDMIAVQKIDTLNKTIHAAQHTVYGFMSNAPWRQWYALNLLEEIDRPGEYVLDAKRGKLYLYPPNAKIENIDISILDAPLLAVENCSNVLVEGITFEYGRNMAVYLENTNHVIIDNCIIRNMGGVGVSIGQGTEQIGKKALKPHAAEAGGIRVSRKVGDLLGKVYEDVLFNRHAGTNNGIRNCYIYQTGAGGISLGGGDRAQLIPSNNFVENCRISAYNRIEKSYRPAIWMDGVGNKISQCHISDAPSMAILFHGNNHIIEYCQITNVCQEVDDQGAIYYGRDPSERGNVIRYCYFNELSPRHRVTATYHDDGACGMEVYGNIYYKAGSLPVLIGGGCDINYTNNIFIDSPVAIHIDNRLQGWGRNMVAKGGIIDQRLQAVRHTEPPYSLAYPDLINYWDEDPSYPKRNQISGNLFYKIKNIVNGQTQWGEFWNNWSTDIDPGFVDATDPLKGFKSNAAIFQRIENFPQLPFDKIGCTLPILK